MSAEAQRADWVLLELGLISGGRDEDLDLLTQDVDLLHSALEALRRDGDRTAHVGEQAVEVLVGLLFILKAAHEPAAYARYLGRIEREVLLLGHFDR